MAKVIQVIEAEDRRGLGQSQDDPVRLIKQYWSLEGQLLWEEPDKYVSENMQRIKTDNFHGIKWVV